MSARTADELRELGIGKKISDLRNSQNVSLEQLAEKLRLSKVILSEIENEVAPPTVATLLHISKALGVGIHHFFSDAEETGQMEVTRAEERRVARRRGLPSGERGLNYSYVSLAHRLPHKHMEPFFVEFSGEQQTPEALSHDGEEFLYVLEGEIEFRGGGDPVRLRPGDAIYFYGGAPHTLRSVGARQAKAIAVLYPYAQ